METSGDESENSILKGNNLISAPIRFNQKRKLVPLQKVKKRLNTRCKPLAKTHQTLEYYEVADHGELVKDTAENQWLIDSIGSPSEPGENIHESITNDNLAPFEISGIALRQLKRNFIFDKCCI